MPVQGEVVEDEEVLLAGLGYSSRACRQRHATLKIWYDENGEPDPDDLREAVKGRVLLRFQP